MPTARAYRFYASILQNTSIEIGQGDIIKIRWYDKNMALEYRKVERMVKGFANHNRLKILELLEDEPELSVADITERLKMGYENASDHIRKIAIAGLVMKRNSGPSVLHRLTPRGRSILVFCKKLQ